jgi:hypothetical protein
MVAWLQTRQSEVQISAGTRDFSLLHNIRTGFEPIHIPIRGSSQEQTKWRVRLTTHLDLVPKLRMSGATPLLPLYAFMAWTGTTLP